MAKKSSFKLILRLGIYCLFLAVVITFAGLSYAFFSSRPATDYILLQSNRVSFLEVDIGGGASEDKILFPDRRDDFGVLIPANYVVEELTFGLESNSFYSFLIGMDILISEDDGKSFWPLESFEEGILEVRFFLGEVEILNGAIVGGEEFSYAPRQHQGDEIFAHKAGLPSPALVSIVARLDSSNHNEIFLSYYMGALFRLSFRFYAVVD
jgi:hypothetical protein